MFLRYSFSLWWAGVYPGLSPEFQTAVMRILAGIGDLEAHSRADLVVRTAGRSAECEYFCMRPVVLWDPRGAAIGLMSC